ncbi:hypothetical protein [Planctopirus hydrillae]|uniref:Uncharacterized protein n=1 Tax=Planctopirus hydrillae TaxID=1841610 RepID=A0A1C3ESW9_9PLAN|nr:hypothetical protein [Planctopirus hydrillae]ODA36336.1 hypothetical protein A6X21_16130 [Planctopirus hydrillae]
MMLFNDPAPSRPAASNKLPWLVAGIFLGMAISSFWPAEQVQARGTDRTDKFAITTATTGFQNPDTIFVLDFLTGRLVGALLNQQSAQFTNFYFRSIAADFGLDPAAKPQFVIMSGDGNLTTRGGPQISTGVVYIGEMTTGKVVAYRYPFQLAPKPLPPTTLQPFAFFSFRDVAPQE